SGYSWGRRSCTGTCTRWADPDQTTGVQVDLDTFNPWRARADLLSETRMKYVAGKSVVGLDIEPGYVAAVQAAAGGVAVERAATAQLAPGVVREGEVLDVQTLAGTLRTLFSEHKLGKRVRVGVANQ